MIAAVNKSDFFSFRVKFVHHLRFPPFSNSMRNCTFPSSDTERQTVASKVLPVLADLQLFSFTLPSASSFWADVYKRQALCRERADWIVGINATRLFSTLYGQTLNVGRVMTPTLSMAVMREAAIAAFKPEPFYTIQIELDGFSAVSERFKNKSDTEAIAQAGTAAVVTKAERKEKTEKPDVYKRQG